MAGLAEAQGPAYISSRSADVILSDIRPIKLNIEALRSINVFLDEILYSVLHAARSLATHQLKSGLLKVLPTALGKEALLEAEMELRAYRERTAGSGTSVATDDQGKEFNLQWSFELLRLKCQAYSTLSDSDEDVHAEARLTERMCKTASGTAPPKATLVAPAALYLTAILESICEHVLSNVGRVATRDSSRTTATVQDLFVALCEDDSIYGLFKSMKVYEKIEGLSQVTKPRRSKSISRLNDNAVHSASRTSSSQQRADSHPPSALTHTSSLPSRTRLSSESSGSLAAMTMLANPNGLTSRSSFDKARAMKMFSNNRSSADQGSNGSLNESQPSHRKSESVLSEGMKQTVAAYNVGDLSPTDDREFDDMMRSGGTMKVSLTPDRLKSMEVYNKEKGQRATRKGLQKTESRSSLKSNNAIPPTPELPRNTWHPSGSTTDNEENSGNKSPAQRTRLSSLSSSSPPVTAAATRLRSISASMSPGEKLSHSTRKLSKSPAVSSTPPTTYQSRERNMPVQQPKIATDSPARTRNVARNRESLDLDDVMGISEDETSPDGVVVKTSVPRRAQYPVSAGARELIEFLAEGPPDMPDEPVGFGKGSASLDTPKKGGRLQRMISKLTLKDTEQKSNGNSVESYAKSPRSTQFSAGSSGIQSPLGSPLYNKPVPPRPPPIHTSPPSTPSHSSTSLVEPAQPNPRSRRTSTSPRKAVPSSWDPGSVTPDSPRTPVTVIKSTQDLPTGRVVPPPPPKPSPANGQTKEEATPRSSTSRVSRSSQPGASGSDTKILLSPPERQSSKKSTDATQKSLDPDQATAMAVISEHAKDLHRLLAYATNVEECRLIVDMFLAKSGLHPEPVDRSNPSTPPDGSRSSLPGIDANLERSLVELFLGGMGEESEGEGDEQPPPSPADSIVSKEDSVALPMSPPDTPNASQRKGSRASKAAEPVVVNDTQAAIPVAAT